MDKLSRIVLLETYLNDGWEFAEKSWTTPGAKFGYWVMEWMKADVPGHVHLDLVHNGVIADPYERLNELGCHWIDEKSWCYRTAFTWSASDDLPRRVLRFEGLDTVCKIFLNDELIGEHDNMFVPLELDVTDKLVEGENRLFIEFASALNVGIERRNAYFAKECITDDVSRFDPRAFVRKSQYMYGWDWGPSLISCGIWKPAKLLEFAARITDVRTRQEWHEDGSVTLHVDVDHESASDQKLHANVTFLHGDEPSFQGFRGSFHIQNPDLWWPVGMAAEVGKVFPLLVTLSDEDGYVYDSKSSELGLRKIELKREKDSFGESFEFFVNGVPCYARGFNWIPDSSFPASIEREQLEERLNQAVDLGSNMIRIWGGGLYESNDFYSLCSRLGLMVWQDFMFACSYYPDGPEAQEVMKLEAAANIKRLRNYPCLALWCGNNENNTMWDQKWGGAEFSPARYYGENLYLKTIPEVLAELDPNTHYIDSSPTGVFEKGANDGRVGDQHYWDVWHGRGDWKHYQDSEARFSSEYGFVASCSLPVWESVLTDFDWHHRSLAVRWHDKTLKGYETYLGYVRLHYPEFESLEDLVYYSQLNQRDALRFGVEHFRRTSYCRGSLIWQLNDCWPVQSWAVIDSWGRYKAAAYEMRRLYANSLVSLARKNEKVSVWVVNDEPNTTERSFGVTVEAHSLATGESLKTWEFEGTVKFNERAVVGEVDLSGLSTPDTILRAWGTAANETWTLLAEPKESRFAEALPILGTNRSMLRAHETGYFDIRVDSPVVDLMLTVDGDPEPFEDNFLTFVEPGVYTVKVKRPITSFEARSLSGEHATRVSRSPLAAKL